MPRFSDCNLGSFVVGALLLGVLDGCGAGTGAPTDQFHDPVRDDAGGSQASNPGDRDGTDLESPGVGDPGVSSTDAGDVDAGPVVTAPEPPPFAIHIEPTEQVKGDPKKGYDYLVNGNYQTLGLPWSGFSATMTQLEPRDSLPGRTGDNAKVSYMFNVVTRADGVTVAANNCLQCHSSQLNGKVFVGLGNPNPSPGGYQSSGVSRDMAGILLRSTPAEANVLATFAQRGANSIRFGAMDVFPELASHHDPKTLEWQETPLFDADTHLEGSVDVPPWWRAKKKAGLYYTGVGRGQQSRHMSFMSVFSVGNTEEAKAIFENFVNVAEYIRSIEPPAFPGPIDKDLAAQGELVFNDACALCHGTYGEHWTYPNLVIPYADVGTDPVLATHNWVNKATADWFAASYYAGDGVSSMQNLEGYCAPPLDGIWVTAPFFHNGSVPTLDGVIDPDKRPATWTSGFGDDDYDLERVGWKVSDAPAAGRRFDTSQAGNSNQGHTFGAGLSSGDQKAVLEYLKTL